MWEARVSLCRRWFVIIIVQSLSHVWLFVTPWTVAHQAPLSSIISWNLLTFISIEPVMPPNHLILCRPLLILLSIFPSIRVFFSELAVRIRWPNYWSFSFSVSPYNKYSGLISFRDWLVWSSGLSQFPGAPWASLACSMPLSFPLGKKESEVAQSCPSLCDPMDYSLPCSSVHGIF